MAASPSDFLTPFPALQRKGAGRGQRAPSCPTLGRRWCKGENRWAVVLKVDRWTKGTLLLCEAPLAFAGGVARRMGLRSASEEDLAIEKPKIGPQRVDPQELEA